MIDAEFRTYFREQQVSLQWLPILRALAAEFESRESPTALRTLFSAMGRRVADEAIQRFGSPDTLAELEQSLNDFWSLMHWGWVRLAEKDRKIDIAHSACPLVDALGEESLVWSCGFLEGFYQSVFIQLGADPKLQVQWVDMSDEGMTMLFELGN